MAAYGVFFLFHRKHSPALVGSHHAQSDNEILDKIDQRQSCILGISTPLRNTYIPYLESSFQKLNL